MSTGTVHVELRTRALEANLALVRAGLVVLTFGNASEADRDAGLMAIKPSGVPYDALDAAAMVLVDLATGETVDSRHRPSSDTATHVVLYRSFDGAGGVAHTHSPWATAWAQAQREIPLLGTTHADLSPHPVPLTRALTPGEVGADYERATGTVLIEAVGARDPLEVPCALVRGHAPFCWGRDPRDAVENAITLEAVAKMAWLTTALVADPARPAPLDDAVRNKHHQRKHGPQAYYGQA